MGNLRSRSSTLCQWAIWGEAGLPLLVGNLRRSRSSTLSQWAIWEAGFPLLISGQSEEKQVFHSQSVGNLRRSKSSTLNQWAIWEAGLPLKHHPFDRVPESRLWLGVWVPLSKQSTLPSSGWPPPPSLSRTSPKQVLHSSPPSMTPDILFSPGLNKVSSSSFWHQLFRPTPPTPSPPSIWMLFPYRFPSFPRPPPPPHPQSECYFPITSPLPLWPIRLVYGGRAKLDLPIQGCITRVPYATLCLHFPLQKQTH